MGWEIHYLHAGKHYDCGTQGASIYQWHGDSSLPAGSVSFSKTLLFFSIPRSFPDLVGPFLYADNSSQQTPGLYGSLSTNLVTRAVVNHRQGGSPSITHHAHKSARSSKANNQASSQDPLMPRQAGNGWGEHTTACLSLPRGVETTASFILQGGTISLGFSVRNAHGPSKKAVSRPCVCKHLGPKCAMNFVLRVPAPPPGISRI